MLCATSSTLRTALQLHALAVVTLATAVHHRMTCAGEAFDCAAAIVTVPLGCLKAGSITFDPPLPDWKASAIAKLGFGNLNKVMPCSYQAVHQHDIFLESSWSLARTAMSVYPLHNMTQVLLTLKVLGCQVA